MKNTIRCIGIIVLAAMLCLVMTGCNKKPKGDSSTENSSSTGSGDVIGYQGITFSTSGPLSEVDMEQLQKELLALTEKHQGLTKDLMSKKLSNDKYLQLVGEMKPSIEIISAEIMKRHDVVAKEWEEGREDREAAEKRYNAYKESRMSKGSRTGQALFTITNMPYQSYNISVYRLEYDYKNRPKVESLQADYRAKVEALDMTSFNYDKLIAFEKLERSHPSMPVARGTEAGKGSVSFVLEDLDYLAWKGTGNFHVFFDINTGSSGETDESNAPIRSTYGWATVNFSNGKATVDYSKFDTNIGR